MMIHTASSGKTALRRGTLFAGLALKSGVIASCVIGISLQLTASGGSFMSASSIFLYFTIESNIWIALICVVFLLTDVFQRGRRRIGAWLYAVKYMFTVSILLTFVVFAVLLSPLMPKSYLLSPSNIFLHDVTPILALLDFALCDDGYRGRWKHVLLGAIMPLAYAVFVLALSFGGVRFAGSVAPYFFLNYEKLGWFAVGKNGLGVVWWIAIITLLVLAVGAALLKLRDVRHRRIKTAAQAFDRASLSTYEEESIK
jgi:hypothetical protein